MSLSGQYIEQSYLKNVDWALIIMTALLAVIGLVAIHSATLQSESTYLRDLYWRQGVWVGIGLVAMIGATLIDYRTLARFAYPLFILGIITLIGVAILGKVGGGSQRWLSIAGLTIQPSEIMKLVVIILVARIFDDVDEDDGLSFISLFKPTMYILIPFFLVLRQPDLGTALIFMIIYSVMALFYGVQQRTLAILVGAAVVIAPLFWLMLKPYQKKRVMTLLDPEIDPTGQGYHIIQSKIAIGSGGTWGKGIFEGTQSKLNFLPEKHTDFIFSVIAEEVGFVGSLILIGIFFFFIIRLFEGASNARDRFGSLLVIGVGAMFTFHAVYNIGMTLGLFPITGVPLPFISYGGSSLLTNFIAVGLVVNVSMRRFTIE
jgi:rod shape determining protein RodA